MDRNKIVEYVYKSEPIKKALINIKVPDFIKKEDMFSHLIMQLLEMEEIKLIKAYEEGWIDRLCVTIMVNSRSKTGRLYKEYNLFVNNDFIDIKEDFIDINDDLIPILNKALNDFEFKKKDNFLETNFNLELLKMYYFQKLNYRQIEELTGIKSNRVRKSVLKSKLWLKNYIKNKINNDY